MGSSMNRIRAPLMLSGSSGSSTGRLSWSSRPAPRIVANLLASGSRRFLLLRSVTFGGACSVKVPDIAYNYPIYAIVPEGAEIGSGAVGIEFDMRCYVDVLTHELIFPLGHLSIVLFCELSFGHCQLYAGLIAERPW